MRTKVLVLILFLPLASLAQTSEYIQLSEINEQIYIDGLDEGYHKLVSVTGSCTAENQYFLIQFYKTDRIEIVSASYKNFKGKTRDIEEDAMFDTPFSTGPEFREFRSFEIYLPSTTQFEIKYKIHSAYLIQLFYLPFDSRYQVGTSTKTVHVPKDLKFYYALQTKPDEKITSVVNAENSEFSTWLFTSTEISRYKNDLAFCHHPNYLPEVYIMFSKPDESPNERLNSWLIDMQYKREKFSDENKMLIDQLTEGLTTETEIAARCFEHLQTSMNNIDMKSCFCYPEPVNVNKLLTKLIGNHCETAYLLVDMLRYKGIEACYAMTYNPLNYPGPDLVFPACFSRAVCAMKLDGEYLVLDPTDKYGSFGKPSIFTQGQMLFITSEDGPAIQAIPHTSSKENQIRITFDLTYEESLSGTFQMTLTGQANEHYGFLSEGWKKSRQTKFFETYSGFFNSPKINVVAFIENEMERTVSGTISLQSYMVKLGNTLLLNPSFLPKPYFFEPGNQDSETNIRLPYAIDVLVECKVRFGEGMLMPDENHTDLSSGNINCFYNLDHENTNQLKITVGFKCDDLHFMNGEMDTFRNIDNQLEKLYQYGIKIK